MLTKTCQQVSRFTKNRKILHPKSFQGVPLCSEGRRYNTCRRNVERFHPSEKEEEEAPPVVDALQENPAEEGDEQQPRVQLHALRPPRSELRPALPLRRGPEFLRKVLQLQLRLPEQISGVPVQSSVQHEAVPLLPRGQRVRSGSLPNLRR